MMNRTLRPPPPARKKLRPPSASLGPSPHTHIHDRQSVSQSVCQSVRHTPIAETACPWGSTPKIRAANQRDVDGCTDRLTKRPPRIPSPPTSPIGYPGDLVGPSEDVLEGKREIHNILSE